MICCFWLLHLSPTLKHTYVLCFKVKKIRNTIAWFNSNKFGKLICFSTFVFLHICTLWRLLQSLLWSPYLYSSNILSKRVLKADSCMFSPSLSRLLSFRILCNKIKIIWLRLSTIDLLSPELLPDFIHIILMNLNIDRTITGIIAPFVYSPLCWEYSVKRRNIFSLNSAVRQQQTEKPTYLSLSFLHEVIWCIPSELHVELIRPTPWRVAKSVILIPFHVRILEQFTRHVYWK